MAEVDAAIAALSASAPAKACLATNLWFANLFIRHPPCRAWVGWTFGRYWTLPIRFCCDFASGQKNFGVVSPNRHASVATLIEAILAWFMYSGK
jgi:hypothetical protein